MAPNDNTNFKKLTMSCSSLKGFKEIIFSALTWDKPGTEIKSCSVPVSKKLETSTLHDGDSSKLSVFSSMNEESILESAPG